MEANTRKNKAVLGALLFLVSSITISDDKKCRETDQNIFSDITTLFTKSELPPSCKERVTSIEHKKMDKSYTNDNWTDDLYRTKYKSIRNTKLGLLQELNLDGNISSFTVEAGVQTSIIENDLQTLKGYNTIK